MTNQNNADSKYLWMDGSFVPYAEAKIHVLCHSLHYGCAPFEGIRAYQTSDGRTAVFRLNDHYVRFLDSMRSLKYATDYSVSDFTRASCELIKRNEFKECYIRPIAFIDDSIRGLKLPEHPKTSIAIAVWNWGKYMGAEGQKLGVRVAVSTYRRPDVGTSLPSAKLSGGYLTSVLARQEATENGFDEAILLDPHGFVAEGSGENLFMVKDGVIFTPPPGFILAGITRDSVLKLAKHLGYEVREQAITRNQLYLADELFFTGTAVEVTAIREVDHRTIGTGKPGPVTQALGELFFKCIRGDVPKFGSWLTYV